MLDEALVHSSSSVRISAFSVLCHQKKKGEAPSSDEMTKIGHFIGENLTVDSPSFRQEFLSDFTSLTIRCRNFCVANLKKNVAVVEAIVQHLDDLTKKLINNLFQLLFFFLLFFNNINNRTHVLIYFFLSLYFSDSDSVIDL